MNVWIESMGAMDKCIVLYVLVLPSYDSTRSLITDVDNFVRCKITGSAVALHCYKAHPNINRKMENSTACKMVIPENFILKLGTCDDVEEVTYYTIFDADRLSGGFSPNRWNITCCDFFPVLSCPFFFLQRAARTARPIFTLYGSNDVVPPKDGLFGG